MGNNVSEEAVFDCKYQYDFMGCKISISNNQKFTGNKEYLASSMEKAQKDHNDAIAQATKQAQLQLGLKAQGLQKRPD
ncbi:unnamed protein product [Clavelina lepadiformis]|uniref:Uncharacterized protein n=1 Tax=Clavelina lepadiformis TaxID=159417 RepID=A0ABP0FRT4_CLALP